MRGKADSSSSPLPANEVASGAGDGADVDAFFAASGLEGVEDEGYESVVVGRRVRITDDASGFAETLDVTDTRERFTTAADVLSRAAGVQVRKTGGAGAPSMMGIRGSTSRQVPIYLNGVEIGGAGSSAVDLSDFSLDLLDSIEVYRGSAPIAVGQSGIGGAVVLRTPNLENPFSRVTGTIGSFGTRRLSVGHGTPIGKGNGLMVLTAEHSDGDFPYLNRNGTPLVDCDDRIDLRSNNHHTAYSVLLDLGGPLGKWRWGLTDALVAKHGGAPGMENLPTETASTARLRNITSARLVGPIGDRATLSLDVGFIHMKDEFKDPQNDFRQTTAFHDARARSVPAKAILSVQWKKAGETSIVVDNRFEVLHREENNFVDSTALPEVMHDSVRLGASQRWQPVPVLTIEPALRLDVEYDRISETEGNQGTAAFAVPSLGVKVDPLHWLTLRAGVGRYVRTPDLDELYGAFGSVVGNPKLDAEDAVNGDAGATVHYAGRNGWQLSAEAAWFCSYVDNLIVYETNSQYEIRPENSGKAVIQGAETGVHIRAADMVSLKAVYTFLYTANRSGVPYYEGNRLPGKPVHQVYGKVEFGGEGKHLGGLLWLDADFAGETYLKKSNQADSAVPARLFLGAGYRLTHKKSGTSLTLEVHNALNHITAKTGNGETSPISDFVGFPLPGREIFLTFAWKG